ncbi:hypothetical protein CAEBREN_19683 [Caenorhabditis brenneri]|uniref:Uncharacterized protein n=1 Tax=Caenorhabditis brenneri TaxID=135651 RepID=G0M8C3_CAEBE|nr:hypothetical protein CAEBREN_19683 [Caenorhabditis brenneri]
MQKCLFWYLLVPILDQPIIQRVLEVTLFGAKRSSPLLFHLSIYIVFEKTYMEQKKKKESEEGLADSESATHPLFYHSNTTTS